MTNAQAVLLAASIVVAGALSGLLSGGRYEAIGTQRVLDRWTGSQHLPDLTPIRQQAIAQARERRKAADGAEQTPRPAVANALADMEAEGN